MVEIHPQLRKDCYVLGRMSLCHVLLMNDANYPWCILVPDREVREIYELSPADQTRLIEESSLLAAGMAGEFAADKMNVAALGNVVPQLHIHHVVRNTHDLAWPAPVWGRHPARQYNEAAQKEMISRIKRILTDHLRVE